MKNLILPFILLFSLTVSAQSPGGVSSNLHLWLKADAECYSDAGSTLSTDGDEVQEWDDQESGTVLDAATTDGNGPAWDEDGINFNPTVDFTGGASGEELLITNGILESGTKTALNCWAVCATDLSQTQALFYQQTNSSHVDWHYTFLPRFNTDAFYYDHGTNSLRVTGTSGATLGQPHLWSALSDGADMEVKRDGSSIGTDTDNGTSTETTTYDFKIGTRYNNTGNYWDGKLSELIIYDGTPSATEQSQIESYLAIKYGIHYADQDYLAADATVVWDYSANTAYHFDVAGIGADATSGLDQRQSKSLSSDAVVTMSTEAIGTTNAGNSTALTDDTYLLWGNNNATAPAGDDLPAGYYGRLDKEWKVDMTGTVSNVHVEFDLSSDILHLAGDAAGDFFILTDADGDFTSGATATVASSFSGNKVTFNDINFTDGHFFTLATQQGGPGGVSSHLQVWLKADAETYSDAGSTLNTNATEVQEWHDQSGGTYDFTDNAGVGPDWDEDALNFNPGVDFVSGSSENLELSGGMMGTSATYDRFFYCVSRHDLDQNARLFREDCAANEYDAYVAWGATNLVIFDVGNSTNGQGRIQASFTDFGNFYLWGLTSDETAANTPSGSKKQILRDNTSLDTDNPTTNNSLTGNGSTMS